MAKNENKMITFDEGLEVITRLARPLVTERVRLADALTRVLAEDVFSDVSMPPFNKSAMDGYACRKSDILNVLEIIDEIPAGSLPSKTIGVGQCARIMTGAMVPDGADVVIMKEHAEEIAPGRVQCVPQNSVTNICYKGEDVKAGDMVLKKGALIAPAQIAILASAGHIQPLVYRTPSVAIISTGSELVEPDCVPEASKIRNSNSYQLAAQVRQMGIEAEYLGIAPDDEIQLTGLLKQAMDKYQVILVSGGVSVGDFDFVPKILKQQGVAIRVHGMDVKPGKHLLFGERDDRFIFGLPGNPVSSFVQFEVLVKPFLKAMMGHIATDMKLYLPLGVEYSRKKSDQLFFVPATFSAHGSVVPLEYHGSAHIHAYTMAHGIMEIPAGVLKLKKGDLVCVRPL